MKPYAEAADRNKEPIGQVLAGELELPCRVLEIGTGTAQHAVEFARRFSQVHWITSDLAVNHPGIAIALAEANLGNLEGPLELDVAADRWPELEVQVVYTSNTCHIMSWPEVRAMLAGVGSLLPSGGRLFIYGPFMVAGLHTAESNRTFDAGLRRRASHMGLRDVQQLQVECEKHGLRLDRRYTMPANNFMLCWSKGEPG